MNEWMGSFISRCLADVPPGKYRRRMEAELRDHMEMLRQSLTEAEVLRVMGDPERLRKEYYIAWKQTPLCRVNWIISGGFVIWGLIILSTGLTAVCFEYIMGLNLNYTEGLVRTISMFLIPFPLGALFLRVCFREECRRAWWVTLGLLVSWASFHLYLIVGMIAIEAFGKHPGRLNGHSPLVALLGRNPWMTPYLCLSFAGCLVLGQIFGKKRELNRKLV